MKNSRMPRCCQLSEDRQEPSAGRSRSATDKLGDTARSEKWRNPGGKKGSHPFLGTNSFGAPWKGEGPLPLMGVAPQLQPLEGMLLRRSTDIYPKELARGMREFFNSLLGAIRVTFIDSAVRLRDSIDL